MGDWLDDPVKLILTIAGAGVGGILLFIVAMFVLGGVLRVVFGKAVGRGLDDPVPGLTIVSPETGKPMTLRELIERGELPDLGLRTSPQDRVKVLEDLHAQGGISAEKLAELKAAIRSEG